MHRGEQKRERNFNPRPPRGGRRSSSMCAGSQLEFQSTPPARGATVGTVGIQLGMVISIHAPREGGDSKDAQFYLRIFDK